MLKDEALHMLDEHKNKMLDPCEMLHWTWLRTILAHLTEDEWNAAMERALPVLRA